MIFNYSSFGGDRLEVPEPTIATGRTTPSPEIDSVGSSQNYYEVIAGGELCAAAQRLLNTVKSFA